ncbi:MAG: UvrD-helicase domain-containing protein, partial [Spiroplasma sp.]
VAGAGSGKTTTILGKIKYLVEVCHLKPKQILVLSYSNKSVNDFNERIKKYLEYDIKAHTIHAFSQSITTQVLGQKKYSVADENIRTEAFMQCLNNPTFNQWWSDFIAYYWDEKITDSEIEAIMTGKKPPSAPSNAKIVTLKNEKVKSSEEARIANFFFLNGINYQYEERYEIDTWTESYVQYKPDFYLVDDKIYWEHFGLDKNHNTMWHHTHPKVDENYKKSREWKIKLHETHKTKLIQSFSYELRNNEWKQLLADKLKSHNISLKPISLTKEQLKELIKTNKQIEKAVELFSNLTSLYEEYELTPKILQNRLMEIKEPNTFFRVKLILKIFFTVWKQYKTILENKNLITYAQMIKKGYENLKHYRSPYRYLMIDEFQDISPLRMKLINQLILDQQIKKFYFVGDDWQSIYGFSGSRVELFINLLKHPEASVSFINNTYRNSQQLIDITSQYVTKDNNLTKKSLQSQKQQSYPIRIYEYQVNNSHPEKTNQAEIIAKLIAKHYQENENYQFLILARTNISKEQLWIGEKFYQKKRGSTIYLKDLPQAKIRFITIHGSKGLEADFVFVLHASDYLYGLPCQITNDPVSSLFDLTTKEMNDNEERRIFYVALTRTKNIVYLLTESENHSLYIDEITNFHHDVETNYQVKKEIHKLIIKVCPVCQLILKSNDFYVSCPNYKLCGLTVKNKDISDSNKICALCNWIMVLRFSKYGYFYVCLNVNCRHKIDMKGKIKSNNTILAN